MSSGLSVSDPPPPQPLSNRDAIKVNAKNLDVVFLHIHPLFMFLESANPFLSILPLLFFFISHTLTFIQKMKYIISYQK